MNLLITEYKYENCIVSGERKYCRNLCNGLGSEFCGVGDELVFGKGKRKFKVESFSESNNGQKVDLILLIEFEGQKPLRVHFSRLRTYEKIEFEQDGKRYSYDITLCLSPKRWVSLEGAHCTSHSDRSASHHCQNCGEPICEGCYNSNQIYSVAAEGSLHLCQGCYDASVRYYDKNKR